MQEGQHLDMSPNRARTDCSTEGRRSARQRMDSGKRLELVMRDSMPEPRPSTKPAMRSRQAVRKPSCWVNQCLVTIEDNSVMVHDDSCENKRS